VEERDAARPRRWVPVALGGFLVFIFPWTLYLAYSLPAEHVTPHWSLAWAGFDLLEAAGAGATLLALLRRSPLLPVVAAATGALLLCDAWFDVVTSRPGGELAWSATTAALAELPLAGLCFWLAASGSRRYRAT
jgi:hypothetical protein